MNHMIDFKNLTPEQDLLLRCIRIEWNPEGTPENLLKNGVNWSLLRDLALGQGVFPLVFQRLKGLPPGLIPEGEQALYKDLFIANGRRNLRLAQRLIQVLTLLNGRGIKALPFKGPVLALQAYGDLSARQITDLDFLIQNRDVENVYRALGEAGYRTETPMNNIMLRYLARTGKDFWLRGQDTQLDFHQQIPEGPPSFRLKEILWEDLRSLEILDCRIKVMSPENSLFLLLIHGTEHGWNTLKVIADLGYFIQATPEIDWGLAVTRARELRGLRILVLGLILAERLLGLVLPPELRETLNPNPKSLELAEKIIGRIFKETGWTGELTIFQKSFDSLPDRIKYIGYYALAPRAGDWMTLPLPGPLFPVYYFYRPLHVLAKFGPALVRSFFSRPASHFTIQDDFHRS